MTTFDRYRLKVPSIPKRPRKDEVKPRKNEQHKRTGKLVVSHTRKAYMYYMLPPLPRLPCYLYAFVVAARSVVDVQPGLGRAHETERLDRLRPRRRGTRQKKMRSRWMS